MSRRDSAINAFLSRHGWGEAQRGPLAGDASFRRYERVVRNNESLVLMDAPLDKEEVGPFVAVSRLLRDCGLSAPEIRAQDSARGLLLLEDFGDALYSRVLVDGGDEMELYSAAVDVLLALHARVPDTVDLPPYDDARLHAEADLLVDWYLPEMLGKPTSDADRRAYSEAWQNVFPLARAIPNSVVLRDYHADNLIWLNSRDGVGRVGLLDFQDAVVGPIVYDLVSLLEDARRDVAAPVVDAAIARYLDGRPEISRDAFAAAYAVMGAQRNCKIIGIFTRLWRRDGKPGYLDFLARVFRHLENDLVHPALAPVNDWFDAVLPAEYRGRPRGGT